MASDHAPLRAAMEGGGSYNRNSAAQAAGTARLLELWQRAAHDILVGGEALVIADYGSSEGANSMKPIGAAIEAVRDRAGADKPVQVFHTDLPSNDFTSLFKVLHEAPDSYLNHSSGIFAAAIGHSYFEPILPPGQVHLGWSANAVHWLSRNPIDAPDNIGTWFSAKPEVRAAGAAQAAADWRQFLTARATELRDGGKLVLSALATADQPSSAALLWSRHLWDGLVEAGRAGLLSEQEQLQINLPTWRRDLTEFTAPLVGHDSVLGLRLEHIELWQNPDPYWDSFEQTGNAAQFGEAWAGHMRAIVAPTILAVIGPDRVSLLDRLFTEVAARINAAPRPYQYDVAGLVVSKTG